MNQQIIFLLIQSYSSTDSRQIMHATEQLLQFAPIQGFLPTLMQISTNLQIDENVTCAALTQIKNCIRRYWDVESQIDAKIFLNRNDKKYLKNSIIALNIALSDNSKYGKLIKDIISMIGGQLTQQLQIVIKMLQGGQQLRTCLNFLLGMIGSFKIYLPQQQHMRIQFISQAVPQLTNLMINGQLQLNQLHDDMQANPTEDKINNYISQSAFLEELMYLSIKFMTKVIDAHVPLQVRQWLIKWGQVCLNRLNDFKPQHHTKEINNNNTPFWQKQSQIYVYFHARKWAIKYLCKFITKILVYKASEPAISNLTNSFYQIHWNSLIDMVKGSFLHNQPNKIRVCQFHLLQTLFRIKPKPMQKWLSYFQFQVLPNYILFQQQDYILATSDPVQYLAYQDENQCQSQNLRYIAAQLWVYLTKQYGQRLQQGANQQLIINHYGQSFRYIFDLINSSQKMHQLAGVYLMQKLCKRVSLPKLGNLREDVTQLTNILIQKYLHSKDSLIQSKVLEISNIHLDMISPDIRAKVLRFIFKVFEAQSSQVKFAELIRINTIIALKKFTPVELSKMSQELIQKLLDTYLQMLVVYELEEIMLSFQSFMSNLRERIRPHAVKIVKDLGQSFNTFYDKSISQNYKRPNFFFAANRTGVYSGALQAISLLCSLIAPQNCQLKDAIQKQIDLILQQFFGCDQFEANQILQLAHEILSLLKEYLTALRVKNHQISPAIGFYYTVMVLKLSTLPPTFAIKQFPQLPFSAEKIRVLRNCCCSQNFLFMDYFNALKIFLKFISGQDEVRDLNEVRMCVLASNQLQQLFYMIFSFYQPLDHQEDISSYQTLCKGRIISTILLIYLIEEHHHQLKESAYRKIFYVIKSNFRNDKISKYILRYNKQLFYIWIWAYFPAYFSEKGQNQKEKVTFYVAKLLQKQQKQIIKTQFYQEKRRILLGYCSLLKMSIYVPKVKQFQSKILCILFAIMKSILTMYEDNSQANSENEEDSIEMGYFQRFRTHENFEEKVNSNFQQYSDQPNYVIQLAHQLISQTDNFDFQIKEFTDPNYIYDMEYVSRLDTIQNEIIPFLQCLALFKNCDPQGFRFAFNNANYSAMLEQLIRAAKKSNEQMPYANTQDLPIIPNEELL